MSLKPTLKFEKLWSLATSADPIDMVENGKYVYVLTTSGIDVFEWWGESSGHEIPWASYGNIEWTPNASKLIKVNSFSAAGFKWLLLGDNCLFLVNNTSIKKVDLSITEWLVAATGDWATNLTIEQHTCNPCYVDGFIWFVRKPVGLTQSVDIVKVADKSINTIDFPVKKQDVRADIAYGYNGYVYITSWNGASVIKYDISNFSVAASIRVNANPYKIKVDQANRRIYVASYGGMLSWIDPTTDAVTHAHSTAQTYGDAPDTITTDGMITDFEIDHRGYIWYAALKQLSSEEPVATGIFTDFDPNIASASLGRIEISTNKHNFIPMYETISVPKYSLSSAASSGGANSEMVTIPLTDRDYFIKKDIIAPDKILINTQFDYQYWDGSAIQTTTVHPYLFIIDDRNLYCIRLVNELCRENKLEITAHHMITQGPFDYTGDKA